MLDGWARRQIDPALDQFGFALARAGISANVITVAACAVGFVSAYAISQGAFLAGLGLMLLSRLADGIDGAVAKINGKTDFGGYLDIVLDFAVYGAIPLGFIFADPAANGLAGAVLIFSFYVNGSSFLAYAIMAEKQGLRDSARPSKSFFFTTGLAEATETIAAFAAMCLLPRWFPVLAWAFAALCFYTALSRIVLASRMFR